MMMCEICRTSSASSDVTLAWIVSKDGCGMWPKIVHDHSPNGCFDAYEDRHLGRGGMTFSRAINDGVALVLDEYDWHPADLASVRTLRVLLNSTDGVSRCA